MKTDTMELPAKAYPKEIGSLVQDFMTKSRAVAADKIALTNSARQIGLLFQSWCAHEQPTFEFFEHHRKELPKELTFDMVRTFVHIAHRMPKPAEKIEEVRRVWQLDFQAAGLMEMPTRHSTQSRVTKTKFMEFANRVAQLRAVLVEWNVEQPFETWGDDVRGAVRQQLQPLVDFHSEL